MTAETAIKKLRNRSMGIRQMGDEEIEAKYTAYVINETNEYAK
ncbi:hypothetical protein ABX081_003047 [Listeria innocua]